VPQPLHELVGLRLTDFPLRCLSDPAVFDPSALAGLPRTYVWHTDPPLANLERSRTIAQMDGWELRELRSGHDMMLEAPEETAALLEDLCEQAAAGRSRNRTAAPGVLWPWACGPPNRATRPPAHVPRDEACRASTVDSDTTISRSKRVSAGLGLGGRIAPSDLRLACTSGPTGR
jgi:hypothetical protein